MRIYDSITLDMTRPLAGGRFEVISATWHDHDGAVVLCKGDSNAQAAEKSQVAFTSALQAAFAQQFGANQAVLNFLNGKLTDMVKNPVGFDPATLAAMRTNAIQQTATDYANASRAVNNSIAARGGSTLPSGVTSQIEGQLAAEGANEETSNLNQITLANEEQKQRAYWNAISGLGGVASGYAPNAYAGDANSGGSVIAGLSQANTAANNSGLLHQFLGGLGQGLGAGLGSFATGGLSAATGWGFVPKGPAQPAQPSS